MITSVASQAGLSIELHETADGEDADQLIAETEPDLIVCEILLQKVSGLELLRKQRSRLGDKAPPFIFVTHMTAETDRYWGLRNGAFAYVMKPYEPSILDRRVRKALGQPAKPPTKKSKTPAKAPPKVQAEAPAKASVKAPAVPPPPPPPKVDS